MHPKTPAPAAATTTVAEVVTFHLMAGTDPAAFARAARETEGPLRAMPGFVRRRLVRADSGQWTDWVEWRDHAAANAAAEAVIASPDFASFLSMIDPATVTMRHDAVIMAMD